MLLTEFLALLGYGTKITVVDHPEDITVFESESFITPYTVKKGYENAKVAAFGVYSNNRLIVWVTK